MRIVAGERKGTRLTAPRGAAIRPTSDMVREALYSMLHDVSGERALDTVRGSGALGLEALSRGAEWAGFCDTLARRGRGAIRSNIERLGYGDRTAGGGHRRGAGGWRPTSLAGRTYDLMLIDPPYTMLNDLQRHMSLHIPESWLPVAAS